MATTARTEGGSQFARRRFIAVAGAAAGLAVAPAGLRAEVKREATLEVWQGVALGARASIRLLHPEAAAARRALAGAVAEIERLERIFSLYRPDSAVTRLNAAGRLEAPPLELVELLGRARAISAASDGAFDVTIQPLWQRYRDHFAAHPDGEPPGVDDLLPLVDWRAIRVEPGRIAFERPGMALSLNGIAQGYVTDRVAERLRREGFDDLLLDLGEVRGEGSRPDGRPWRAGIADPSAPARSLGGLEVSGRAVASSGGYGTAFDGAARFTHIIDPRSGRTAAALRGVTVGAPDAVSADGWSTAFSLMPRAEIADLARRLPGTVVCLALPGRLERVA